MIDNFLFQKTVIKHTDGTYLILRRSNTDSHKPLAWDLPGGMLDDNETLESGALREVVEEVGSKLALSTLIPRYTYCTVTEINGRKRNYMKIVYVTIASSKEVTLSYEHDIYEWVGQAEFIKRFASQPRYYKAVRYIIDNKLDDLA